MDNAQKAIMIGVGLFITIIVIAAVMLITGMGQDLLNSGTEQLSSISSQLESQITSQYDNKQLTGAQVLAAVKTYYNSTDIGIAVRNATSGTNYAYVGAFGLTLPAITSAQAGSVAGTTIAFTTNNSSITAATTNKSKLTDFSSSANALAYIVTTGTYKSQLVTLNDGVIGIVFYRSI